jgi:glyceraldehyde-3-phosphate dehydrogenase (NADP+)
MCKPEIPADQSSDIAMEDVQYTFPTATPPMWKKEEGPEKPYVAGKTVFINGKSEPWEGKCTSVTSPIIDAETGERAVIGELAAMDEATALRALDGAVGAWNKGQGAWPQMSLQNRIAAIEAVMNDLKARRSEIVSVLMWEICKNAEDAAKEFDRTMDYATASIAELKRESEHGYLSSWTTVSGFAARVRRGPLGVVLFLAPFNYPLNEMYAMLIPALVLGNTCVLKLPAVGGSCHLLTIDAFAKHLPGGVINFVTGSGRATCNPIMKTGKVDCLGFIGGHKAADSLIQNHPHVHRLKVFSQLEGKNIGIVMPDANLDTAAAECALGGLSYNGQRCTGVKLVMVHESVADVFVDKLKTQVAARKVGLPWEAGVLITPLPEPNKPEYLQELVADAVTKGAHVVNAAAKGGTLAKTLLTPPVVFPVTKDMRLFQEEQFGPVVPVATYSDISEVYDAIRDSWNGQQASVFTKDGESAAPLVDLLATTVCRININCQCGRSPDVFPFAGRRSSAMGTMSITGAIREFSVETALVYAAKSDESACVAKGIDGTSSFYAPVSGPSAAMRGA